MNNTGTISEIIKGYLGKLTYNIKWDNNDEESAELTDEHVIKVSTSKKLIDVKNKIIEKGEIK